MSRHAPNIIEQIKQGDYLWTVAETEATWQILRYERPIYLIKQHWLQDRKTYPRTAFSSQAHAQRLADRLNHLFRTTAYTVRRT